jgi:ATP-dependent exoDNAse (exonuclease V) alpha subunit
MLIKNDSDKTKRWVNGTIGEIAYLSENRIDVVIDSGTYQISRESWDKTRYVYNKEEKKIEQEVIGSFTQYPVKLAWAITIHKSQGQTFDNVVIDLGDGAFTHGQVYVALSRCTKLDGISLKRPVMHSDIIFDERVHDFRKVFIKHHIE